MLKKLLALGGNEWKKHNHHRVYFDIDQALAFAGIKKEGGKFYDKHDFRLSRRQFQQIFDEIAMGKVYYDLTTGEVGTRGISEALAADIAEGLQQALDTVTADEETSTNAEAPSREEAEVVAPDVMTATGTGIPARDVRVNKKGGYCRICGGYVKPGEGHLYYIDSHEAYEHSGWIVEHKSRNDCRPRTAAVLYQ